MKEGIAIMVGILLFIAGFMAGVSMSLDFFKNDCRDYGRHKIGEYMAECHKVSP